MTTTLAKSETESRAASLLVKNDAKTHAFVTTGRQSLSIKAGTIFNNLTFETDTPVHIPAGGLEIGADHIIIAAGGERSLAAVKSLVAPTHKIILGGFHFAPGGNAPARAGGDSIPAINPASIWDLSFRPACPDPRGMAFSRLTSGPCWTDIYMLGRDHLENGTSRFGATIADGDDPPQKPAGGYFGKLDYDTACAVYRHHGKKLHSVVDLFELGYGVTEQSACGRDPRVTGLDAARTSRDGLMQITGNLYQWCHNGDPENPRASIFGGDWWDDGFAGSRLAHVGVWAVISHVYLGARGRGDHLQLG